MPRREPLAELFLVRVAGAHLDHGEAADRPHQERAAIPHGNALNGIGIEVLDELVPVLPGPAERIGLE